MAKKLNLNLKSIDGFVTFLKRFSSISQSVLLELTPEYLQAKSHTPDRAAVKFSRISLDSIFDYDKRELSEICSTEKPVLIGIFSIEKLIKGFSQFSDVVTLIIEVDSLESETVALNLLIKNSDLEIQISGAPLQLFIYITDEKLKTILNAYPTEFSIKLQISNLNRIISLGNFDSDYKILNFKESDGYLVASGKTFDLKLSDASVQNISNGYQIGITKTQLAFLDKEEFMMNFSADRIIFESQNSNTTIIIGKTTE